MATTRVFPLHENLLGGVNTTLPAHLLKPDEWRTQHNFRNTSLAVVDDSTLKINFKKFNALHLYAIVITVPIFSPTSLQVNGAEWAQTHGIGTGPFKLADMKSSSYANFTRFDNYWGPKPYLDGINQIVIADNSVASLTIQKKDADMWDTSGIKESQDLRNMGYQVIQRRAALAFLAWDSVHTNMPWANQKVREAIEYAIDRPGIAQARGFGAYEPLTQAAAPADVCYNPDAVNRVYNPAKAKQLLAEAGFASGFKTKLAVQASLQQNIDTATLIQSYLAAVNINVDIDPLDTAKWSSYTAPGGQGWTNSFSYGITGVNAGLDYVRWTLANTFAPIPNGWYPIVAKSQGWTDLYNQLMSSPTLDDAAALGKKMVKQFNDDVMVVPLWTTPYSVVAQTYVHTNLLSAHHQIWSPGLDWMDKPAK